MWIFSWIIILSLILNVVYYYYKNIYTYILIIATIILLGIAVVFKMISTINQ
jgi:membrane protease YdiL (CAAX protease family)